MKSIGKKVITGTLAATLVLGGGFTGLHFSKAYAEDAAGSSSASSASATNGGSGSSTNAKSTADNAKHVRFQNLGDHLVKDTASLLNIDKSAVLDELKQGKTLAQIAHEKAGWDETTLVQKLTANADQKIDAAVSAGKLTKDKADKLKTGIANRVKKAVENPKYRDRDWKSSDKLEFNYREKAADLAKFLGITEKELTADLKAGKSLADIAKEKGISEDQLIAKLKDDMTDGLKRFVERKKQAKPQTSSTPSNSQTGSSVSGTGSTAN